MTAKLHAIQAGPKKADPADLLKALDELKVRVEAGEVTGIFWFELYSGNVFPGVLGGYTMYPVNDLEFDGLKARMMDGVMQFGEVEDE